ncbi:MAG TPA: YIP1 family protein [Dissulfurispiraceae bacterium]|nr:YIP1 family protein [Dissulfurispiraceae bacterium]
MMSNEINFAAIPQTAMRFISGPAAFYREMPKTGGFVEPLVFMVVIGVVVGLLQAVASIVGLHFTAGVMAGIGAIVVVPIAVAIFGFVGAAIIFAIWKMLGSEESYETAYRCTAYATSFSPIVAILGFIPYIGGAVGVVIWTMLLIIASTEVHNIPLQKARMVFGIIAVILILFSISSQFAARKMVREMEVNRQKMEDASRAMQKQAEMLQRQAEQMQKGQGNQ